VCLAIVGCIGAVNIDVSRVTFVATFNDKLRRDFGEGQTASITPFLQDGSGDPRAVLSDVVVRRPAFKRLRRAAVLWISADPTAFPALSYEVVLENLMVPGRRLSTTSVGLSQPPSNPESRSLLAIDGSSSIPVVDFGFGLAVRACRGSRSSQDPKSPPDPADLECSIYHAWMQNLVCPPKPRSKETAFAKILCSFWPVTLDRDVSFTLTPVDSQLRPIPQGMSREMRPHMKVFRMFRKFARQAARRTIDDFPGNPGHKLHKWTFQIGMVDGVHRESFDPALTVGAVRLLVESPGAAPSRRYLTPQGIYQVTFEQRRTFYFCGTPRADTTIPGAALIKPADCKTETGRHFRMQHPDGLTPADFLPLMEDPTSPVTWWVEFLVPPGGSVPFRDNDALFFEFDVGDTTLPAQRLELDRGDLSFANVGSTTPRQYRLQVFTISNTGRTPIIRGLVTITGADAAHFRILGSNTGSGVQPPLSQAVIQPGGFEIFSVEYAPTPAATTGATHRARVEFPSSAPGTPHGVNLVGVCTIGCP